MSQWWCRNNARVRLEKESVAHLAGQEDWLTLGSWGVYGGRLALTASILVEGAEYPVRLVYPEYFPLVPAWVEPQSSGAKWSAHQHGKGGSLCLELRPDTWVPSATGADLLKSAHRLLETENPLGRGERGAVVSDHRWGNAQFYGVLRLPVLMGVGCLARLRAGDADNVKALQWLYVERYYPVMVFDSVDCDLRRQPPAAVMKFSCVDVPVVVRGNVPRPLPSTVQELASGLNVDLCLEGNARCLFIFASEDNVVPVLCIGNDWVSECHIFEIPDDVGVRAGRSESARMARVAIVGVGSVGSKISEIILRSGVTRMVLVDGDIFLPSNLERHILDWRDFGDLKVNAVRRKLMNISIDADIDVVPSHLWWQSSSKVYDNDVGKILSCDVIVDASGDVSTALFLGAIAYENGKPFISVQVYEGGIGALVACVIPGSDLPFSGGWAAYGAYCESLNVPVPASGARDYEAMSADGVPIVADDAAVSMAASHAARVVLDVLDQQGELGPRWVLLGFKKGWVFNAHGHNIVLDVGVPSPPVDEVEDVEISEFVIGLLAEAIDAAACPEIPASPTV